MKQITDGYRALLGMEFLNLQNVASIVLAAEGIKPTTHVSLYGLSRFDRRRFMHALASYGLHSIFHLSDFDEKLEGVCMGLNMCHVMKLRASFEIHTLGDRYQEMGEALGYPKTAIDAFVKNTKIASEDVIRYGLDTEDVMIFDVVRPFRLSQQHWRKECIIAREWFVALKKRARPVYLAILIHARRSCRYSHVA